MKKLVLYLTLSVIAVSMVLLSCSEELGYMADTTQEKTCELVHSAKQLLKSGGYEINLPANNSRKTSLSRSSLTYLSYLEPLWDESFTHKQGDETILIVPLKCEDDIRSTLLVTKNEQTTYQFAKVFSRLIVKPSQGESGIYVLTYMPESNYASNRGDIEREMRYSPKAVDFTGFIVSSRLNGDVMRGFLYEHGAISHYFSPPKAHQCHDENCTETHHHQESGGVKVTFNLQSVNQSRSTAYNTSSEEEHCPICYMLVGLCDCVGLSEYCTECGNPKDQCFCNENENQCIYCLQDPCSCEKPSLCPFCGRTKDNCICEKEKCNICDQYDCICNPTDDNKEPCEECNEYPCECPPTPIPIDTCDICQEYPCICPDPCVDCGEIECICITDTSPTIYESHWNDRIIGNAECVNVTTSCAMAVLEMAYNTFGGTDMSQETFAQYYTELNYMSPEENETVLDRTDRFMTHFFETSNLSSITSAINNDDVVVVRVNHHYMLIMGLQYDGDVIYADPHEGGLYVVNQNYFSGCDGFEINGISQNRMRLFKE